MTLNEHQILLGLALSGNEEAQECVKIQPIYFECECDRFICYAVRAILKGKDSIEISEHSVLQKASALLVLTNKETKIVAERIAYLKNAVLLYNLQIQD